jgi:hypothetical protein
MKIKIPETHIGKARVQQVGVGEVKCGPVHVGRLTLNNVQVRTSTGVAELRNVRVQLTLSFALEWKVGLTISMPDWIPDIDISESGTMDLGKLGLGIGFGNLSLPGLANLALDITKLPVDDLSAVIGSLRNIDLGPAVAESIHAQGLVAPSAGFQVDGIGLTGFSAQGVGLGDAVLTGATVGRISGGTLPLPGLSIPSLSLPEVTVPRMSGQNIDAASRPEVTKMPTVDVGLLSATLKVTTTAAFHIDELRLDNITAAASIGEIALKDVELPYEILDLSLSQIGIERIEVPAVEVN